jgi:trigger factor
MQITIEDISPVEKRVECELPWADVAPRLEKAYADLRRDARLKGFRPGKVPRAVVERLYKQQVENEVARELVESSLGQAVQEKQLHPVAPPEVQKVELKNGAPFRFSAKVEVKADVQPKDYAGVALSRKAVNIDDSRVADEIESYRKRFTQFNPVQGRALTQEGDFLTLEVQGKVGEQKIKKRTVATDLDDERGGALPGLASRLRGLPVDATDLDVRYTIDADLPQKELAGAEVALKISIKEVREKKVPAIGDELAKETGEAETLDALREKIKERLGQADRQRYDRDMRGELVRELVRLNPFPIAPSLVDRYVTAVVNRALQQLAMGGLDVQAGIDAGAIDVEKMKVDFRPDAEIEARGTVIVAAIAEKEGVSVTDADLQKRISELAASRGESMKKVRTELEQQGRLASVRAQLVEEKTLDMLISQAKITDEVSAST